MKAKRNVFSALACGLLLAHLIACQTIEKNSTSTQLTTTADNATETTNSTVITTTETAANSNTTVEPNSTTSVAPTSSNVTTASTTVPTTTEKPPEFTWQLRDDNNTVCLILKISATFTDDDNSTSEVKLISNATVVDKLSTCKGENDTQYLTLQWGEQYEYVLSVQFSLNTGNEQYELKNLSFGDNKVKHDLIEASGLTAHKGKSYKCTTKASKKLSGNFTVSWDDVQFQAFMTTSDKGKFGDAEECSNDITSDVVPIAVGCALAGLVIVVLIAYLVGRRKSRQKGYQSV